MPIKAERADKAFSRNNGRRDLRDNSQPRFPNKPSFALFSLIMLVDIKQASTGVFDGLLRVIPGKRGFLLDVCTESILYGIGLL